MELFASFTLFHVSITRSNFCLRHLISLARPSMAVAGDLRHDVESNACPVLVVVDVNQNLSLNPDGSVVFMQHTFDESGNVVVRP